MASDHSLISVADYERAAADLLEPPAHSYFFGGAGDEITMRENLRAWRRFAIRPRMLIGAADIDLGVTVLGRPRPHPLIIAPMAAQGHAHPEGEHATVRAAAAAEAIMCLSTFATFGVTELAVAAPEVCRWLQLYVFADRGVSDELVAQAVQRGYEALVVTVDLPVIGVRERELRFPIEQGPSDMARLIDPSLSWKDIERFASNCPLPVIVKGILTAEDARLAVEHGARAVVVSNHGGRQLDTVISSADALGPIADAVAGEVDVLVDGGIRRGTDVLKALALGARAVLIGRPVLFGLVVGGAGGVRQVLELLIAELRTALALAGAASAAGVDPALVVPAPWEVPLR